MSSFCLVYLQFVPGQTIATQVPVLVCLCFLILRFIWKFFYHAYVTVKTGRILREVGEMLHRTE